MKRLILIVSILSFVSEDFKCAQMFKSIGLEEYVTAFKTLETWVAEQYRAVDLALPDPSCQDPSQYVILPNYKHIRQWLFTTYSPHQFKTHPEIFSTALLAENFQAEIERWKNSKSIQELRKAIIMEYGLLREQMLLRRTSTQAVVNGRGELYG